MKKNKIRMMTGRKLQAEELLEELYCAYFDARKNKRGTAASCGLN